MKSTSGNVTDNAGDLDPSNPKSPRHIEWMREIATEAGNGETIATSGLSDDEFISLLASGYKRF